MTDKVASSSEYLWSGEGRTNELGLLDCENCFSTSFLRLCQLYQCMPHPNQYNNTTFYFSHRCRESSTSSTICFTSVSQSLSTLLHLNSECSIFSTSPKVHWAHTLSCCFIPIHLPVSTCSFAVPPFLEPQSLTPLSTPSFLSMCIVPLTSRVEPTLHRACEWVNKGSTQVKVSIWKGYILLTFTYWPLCTPLT